MTTAIQHPSIHKRRSSRSSRARSQPATTRARRLRGPPPPRPNRSSPSPRSPCTRGAEPSQRRGETRAREHPARRRPPPPLRLRRGKPRAPGPAAPARDAQPRQRRAGPPPYPASGGAASRAASRRYPPGGERGPGPPPLLLPPPRGGPGSSPRPGGAEGRQWARWLHPAAMRGAAAAAAPRPETPLGRRSPAAPRPALAPPGSGPRPRAAPARKLRSTFPSAALGAAAARPGRRPEGRPPPAAGLPAPLAPTPGTCEAAAGGRERGREEAAPLRPPGPAPRRKRPCVCVWERVCGAEGRRCPRRRRPRPRRFPDALSSAARHLPRPLLGRARHAAGRPRRAGAEGRRAEAGAVAEGAPCPRGALAWAGCGAARAVRWAPQRGGVEVLGVERWGVSLGQLGSRLTCRKDAALIWCPGAACQPLLAIRRAPARLLGQLSVSFCCDLHRFSSGLPISAGTPRLPALSLNALAQLHFWASPKLPSLPSAALEELPAYIANTAVLSLVPFSFPG